MWEPTLIYLKDLRGGDWGGPDSQRGGLIYTFIIFIIIYYIYIYNIYIYIYII